MKTLMKEEGIIKLNELKKEITAREEELFREISDALAKGDNITYLHLKQMQLQCTAELRLIKHIEDGMKDNFFIC